MVEELKRIMNFKVTKTPHSTPISKKLASNFIELGYGLQVDGMMAEMFFNRSFEPFYPYRLINKIWYDLLEDEKDHNSRCETDWRVFDWYHSSYEHNAWFAFPGTAGYMRIEDDSTFVIEESPVADVKIAYCTDSCHGKYAMTVSNNSDDYGGIAQDGKYCFSSISYAFCGKIRRVFGDGRLKVAIYREGEMSDPVAVCELREIGDEYTSVETTFSVPVDGRYTFALLLPPATRVVCDDFSLVPCDAVGKWKKSSVEVGKYVSPKVIRWPGGCFSSFYNWRDGVGKYRPPMYSYFWGGYQYNDIGTDELASYAEAVGAESMVCVNVFNPFKRFFDYVPPQFLANDPDDPQICGGRHGRDLPHFSDIEKGAEEAAAWVEYCNGDESTEGGKCRMANGREKPYNIKYWEMDNEVHRWFSSEKYAEACVIYAKKMKAADPTVKIGIDTYSYPIDQLASMLNIAGMDIDFVADRGHDESDLEKKLGIIEEYNMSYGRNIRYCNTEWLPLNGADVYNMVPRSEMRYNKCFMFSKWSYALDAAATLMMWQRHGDVIDFVNFNNLANTHSQSAIETAKEGSYVTAAGMMLHRFANTKAYQTLKIEEYHAQRNDGLHVQISLDECSKNLVINLLNRSESDVTVSLDLSVFNPPDSHVEGVILLGESMISMNTLDDKQISEESGTICVKEGITTVSVQKLSFSEYVVPLC